MFGIDQGKLDAFLFPWFVPDQNTARHRYRRAVGQDGTVFQSHNAILYATREYHAAIINRSLSTVKPRFEDFNNDGKTNIRCGRTEAGRNRLSTSR